MNQQDRARNIDVARGIANMVLGVTSPEFSALLKEDSMSALRTDFSALAQSLARNKLMVKREDGWHVDAAAIDRQPDRVLDDVTDGARKVVGGVLSAQMSAELKKRGFYNVVQTAQTLRPLFPEGDVALSADRLPVSLQLFDLHPLKIVDRDVTRFSGNDRIGSNMYAADVMWGDSITPKQIWHCNEVPYILAKTQSAELRKELADLYMKIYRNDMRKGSTHENAVEHGAKVLKSKARGLELRPDATPGWTTGGSVKVMEELVSDKFDRNEKCARWLLETGAGKIMEGNTWGDIFWGVALNDVPRKNVVAGEGRNELGKIIMKKRDDLRKALGLAPVYTEERRSPARASSGVER